VKKGAPDGLSEGNSSRWWNVVKSVALTASGDNLAEENRGYGSRGDVGLPLGETKGRDFVFSLTIERFLSVWKTGQLNPSFQGGPAMIMREKIGRLRGREKGGGSDF
jgi:hypothetical protein